MAKGAGIMEGIPMLILSVGGIILMLFFVTYLGIIDYRYMVGEIRFIIPKVMYRVRTLREGRRRCWGFTMICGWKITGKNSSFSFISI